MLTKFVDTSHWKIDQEALEEYIDKYCLIKREDEDLNASFSSENSSLKVFLRKFKERF